MDTRHYNCSSRNNLPKAATAPGPPSLPPSYVSYNLKMYCVQRLTESRLSSQWGWKWGVYARTQRVTSRLGHYRTSPSHLHMSMDVGSGSLADIQSIIRSPHWRGRVPMAG